MYTLYFDENVGLYTIVFLQFQELKDFHRPRIAAVLEGGVDLIAFDTIPVIKEAVVFADLLKTEFPKSKAWISFSCKVLLIYILKHIGCILIMG
jgi:S-methylmethionine-dependent homocysteine/selenocysteine methylase